MTVTKKTTEVKEDIIDVEAEENVEKEKTTLKEKAEAGKSWISRHSKKIKTVAVAGLSAIALGAVAVVINDRLGGNGEYTSTDSETPEDGSPFDMESES